MAGGHRRSRLARGLPLAYYYYAASLTAARYEGRIGKVARDSLLSMKAFWDIGVRDATQSGSFNT
ncbi:hypothetical protein MesoLj131a_57050 [Mesorhizobium sp. 131-2-1]|nr:hypothetical protein MesoLj131a_57050 [Mesorhizobium sp. 131-2-1]